MLDEDPEQLAARAKWCRRLAQDSRDEQIRAALEELAQDCERRGQAASGQPAPRQSREVREPRPDQS